MLTSKIPSSSQYRYDTVKEFQQKLQLLADEFSVKKKKYQRRVSAIDIAVYSISGVIAGAGIVLSSVTMTAPIAIPICISAVTTLAGIITGVTKKLSSCSQRKLQEYTIKLSIVSDAYSELSGLISAAINDEEITDNEFSNINKLYNTAIEKLENNIINNVERKTNIRRSTNV